MRQTLSTAIVAVIVSLLTLTVAGAMAQPEPAQDEVTPAALRAKNADKVDGKHAVRATKTLRLRAKKLVATDRTGFLPDNIVQPLWHLIKNKPAGFADNVDNEGVTSIRVTRVASALTDLAAGPGSEVSATANCPAGSTVVGGGGYGSHREVSLSVTSPTGTGTSWVVWATNHGASPRQVTAYALCMAIEPAALLETAKKGKVTPAGKRK